MGSPLGGVPAIAADRAFRQKVNRIWAMLVLEVVEGIRETVVFRAFRARYAGREDGGMKDWRMYEGWSYFLRTRGISCQVVLAEQELGLLEVVGAVGDCHVKIVRTRARARARTREGAMTSSSSMYCVCSLGLESPAQGQSIDSCHDRLFHA